ncbi:MAG: glutamate--cysteine ligase [Rudaea sp.]
MVHAPPPLNALPAGTLARLRRGIEKESLRVRRDGALATTPHPPALGAALTHPHITTDFSESQLELITGVHSTVSECARELTQIHQFVYRHIGDELLWASSMPCRLPADGDIPVGRYGTSNLGRMKTVYRLGLAERYGRRMQAISGVHYNFSLPDAAMQELQGKDGGGADAQVLRTKRYFALIRNFRRQSWLPLYLFGASPAVCRSFVAGRQHRLEPLSRDTLYLPYATSLRMGPLGYQSEAQRRLAVSYNGLPEYAKSLHYGLTETYPAYEALGVRGDDGEYRQLAPTLLQIENEFYGTIRPKRRIRRGERPLHALTERGVEYVEVRSLDVDPFSPIGVDAATMRFLDVFLLHCLLADSPPDSADEVAEIANNQFLVAERGREPGVRLRRGAAAIGVREWGMEILAALAPIAAALHEATGDDGYTAAVDSARRRIEDASRTPSARVLAEMKAHFGDSYTEFALAQSIAHREAMLALPVESDAVVRFARLAEESLAEQRAVEQADDVPFDEYRRRYLAQDLMSGMSL